MIENLDREGKVSFYELLAHNLTISVRVFGSNEDSSDALKVQQMKWLNEIMHQVTSKSSQERLGLHGLSEDGFIKMVRMYIEKCPSIAGDIAWCINSAYEQVIAVENQPDEDVQGG